MVSIFFLKSSLLFIMLSISTYGQEKYHSDYDQVLKIPIVFHVVDKNPYQKIKTKDLEFLVTQINDGFNNVDTRKIYLDYRKDVANCNIYFYIPELDESCNYIKSVFFYKTKDSVMYEKPTHIFGDPTETKLKKNRYLPYKKFLNIWICNINVVGYSSFPDDLLLSGRDGVVINIDKVLKKEPQYLIHEIGHYLGLKHIWGNTNNVKDIHCDKDDGIEDTPNQAGPNYRAERYAGDDGVFQFSEIEKVCENPTKIGNYQNFMDYAYESTSMFTNGQKNKMRETILKQRSGLLWKSNCSNSTPASLLDKKPHRYSRGNHMSMHYQFEASPPIEIEGFFRSTFNYLYNAESLKRLGFYFIGRGKFEDKSTSEIITQKDIYERLNIERAKVIIRNSKSYHAKTNTTSKEKIRYFYDRRTNEKYPFIQIGNQKWMTKNLNYKTDNSRCYKNDENKCAVYGRLYTWEDAKKVCPKGWRLPTKADWDRLLGVIGNNQVQIRSKFGWKNDKNGTNNSGLNFYPSGQGISFGKFVQFSGLGSKTNIWLADSNIKGYSRTINGGKYIAKSGSNAKNDFLSCRCIQSSYNESQKPEEVPLFSKPIPSNQNKEIKEGNTLKRIMKTNRNLFYPNSSSQNDYKKTKKKDGKSSPFYKPSNKKLFYPNTSKGKYKRAKKSQFYPNSSSKKFK